MKLSRYNIRALALREQVRDTYRLWFSPGLVCVAGLICYIVHSLVGGHGFLYR